MALSSNLVSQFTKITNDSNDRPKNTSLRGTIQMFKEGNLDVAYVKLDGSEEYTPVVSTVEVADGNRVEVSITNHSATVTGNLDDPSASSKRVGDLDGKYSLIEQDIGLIKTTVSDLDKKYSTFEQTANSITTTVADLETRMKSTINQTADSIRLEVSNVESGLKSSINVEVDKITNTVTGINNTVTTLTQTIDGWTFEGGSNDPDGKVYINGGSIMLTGGISFEKKIEDIAASAGEVTLPEEITGTTISKSQIVSPTIIGGEIYSIGRDDTQGSTYLKITNSGLKVHDEDVGEDKLQLSYDSTINEIDLILGAGNGDYAYDESRDEEFDCNRFYMRKTSNGCRLIFVTSDGYKSELVFTNNGYIQVNGDTIGPQGTMLEVY